MTYVFLHGLGQLPSSWDEVTAHLPSDIQICCPRLTAIIKNQKVTYETLYSAFENKCSLIEKPLNLCGISLGAVLALQYAINNPQMVKSLILIAPQYKMPKLLLTIQNIVFRILPQKAFQEMGFSKREVIALTNSMKSIDFTPALKRITCPSFIICGQKDKANQKAAKLLAVNIPNAKFSLIENAGHEVNIDAPVKLANLVKEFWFHK